MQRPTQQNKRKTNRFEITIKEFEMKHNEFDSKYMIKICRDNKITSCDFSINQLSKKEFCQNKCKIYEEKVKCGKSLLLYQSLVSKYRINGQCNLIKTDKWIYNEGSLVFISTKCTKLIINNELIKEIKTLNTTQRLFQYFKQIIRVNQINKYIKCYVTQNNIKFIIINTELHNKENEILYMFCIRNDIISPKAQKWQCVKLMTGQQIIKLISNDRTTNNNISLLPKGIRQNAPQFEKWRRYELISKDEICFDAKIYKQLKGVQTNYDRKKKGKGELSLTLLEFQQCIKNALQSNNYKHGLIPIMNILNGNKNGNDYCIDQVLPVYVKRNWIGIVYQETQPVMLLFDVYDIANKAILCDPTFDTKTLSWFKNNICKINIKKSSISPPSQSSPNMKYSRSEWDDSDNKANVDNYNSAITTNNTINTNTNTYNKNGGIGGYQYLSNTYYYNNHNNYTQQQTNNYTTTTRTVSEGDGIQTVITRNNSIDTNMLNTLNNNNNKQTMLSTNTNTYNQYVWNNMYYNNNYSNIQLPLSSTTRMGSEGQGIQTMQAASSDMITLQQLANIYSIEELSKIAVNMGYCIIPIILPPLNNTQRLNLNAQQYIPLKPALSIIKEENEL